MRKTKQICTCFTKYDYCYSNMSISMMIGHWSHDHPNNIELSLLSTYTTANDLCLAHISDAPVRVATMHERALIWFHSSSMYRYDKEKLTVYRRPFFFTSVVLAFCVNLVRRHTSQNSVYRLTYHILFCFRFAHQHFWYRLPLEYSEPMQCMCGCVDVLYVWVTECVCVCVWVMHR